MRHTLFLALTVAVSLLLGGCMRFDQSQTEFRTQTTLSDLQGVYKNRGERGGQPVDTFLSELIWPDDQNLQHAAIDTIEVSLRDAQTLTVTACSGDRVTKSADYVEGVDIRLEDGHIELGLRSGAAIEPEAGVIAVHYENRSIGLDTQGHGRYQSSGVVTGVAMLIIPVIASGEDDTRFVRLK